MLHLSRESCFVYLEFFLYAQSRFPYDRGGASFEVINNSFIVCKIATKCEFNVAILLQLSNLGISACFLSSDLIKYRFPDFISFLFCSPPYPPLLQELLRFFLPLSLLIITSRLTNVSLIGDWLDLNHI